MKISSRPAVQTQSTQAAAPRAAAATAAQPVAAAQTQAADGFEDKPSALAMAGSFARGAFAGAVASPTLVALVGVTSLTLAGVTPFGAAGIAAMATLKTCMAGAFWVGGAVGGLVEMDHKSSPAEA